jgi:hypothetical protein
MTPNPINNDFTTSTTPTTPLPPFAWLNGLTSHPPPQFLGPPIMAGGGGGNRFFRPRPRPLGYGNDAIGMPAGHRPEFGPNNLPPFSWLFGGNNQPPTPPAPLPVPVPPIPVAASADAGAAMSPISPTAFFNSGAPSAPPDYSNVLPGVPPGSAANFFNPFMRQPGMPGGPPSPGGI